MRAVELSTGAFCTEFQCEQLCDDDVFCDWVQLFFIFCDRGQLFHGNCCHESSEALDHCILHGISVRIQPRGRFFPAPARETLIFHVSRQFFIIQGNLLYPGGGEGIGEPKNTNWKYELKEN